MKKFQVLDRTLSLHHHYLLEASAGTGKTFSIQNIVIRLLIESEVNQSPLLLQNILVVTFTKAATRDLKLRIRASLEEALCFLKRGQREGGRELEGADDLKACLERGEEAVVIACKRLQRALFAFDTAQIFTIHAFCARMLRQYALESDVGLHALLDDESLEQSEIAQVIRDFFRTELNEERYSLTQLEILLKSDPQQKKLLKLINSGYAFLLKPTFKEIADLLNERFQRLKAEYGLIGEKIVEDFALQAKCFRNQGDETKAQTFAKVCRFAKLIDKGEWGLPDVDELLRNGLAFAAALNPKLLKGNLPKDNELHYPGLAKAFALQFSPLIEEAVNPLNLMARMASDCRCLLERYQIEEEKFSHDDILKKMESALAHPLFLSKVQSCYQAAIIDEFQDTDPLQWRIFSRLFLEERAGWRGWLYLVGDPKQSIYSFRQADIYTYLSAAQAIGREHCCSLNVNYRSQPLLVKALNDLFTYASPNHFLPLPRLSLYLPYQSVEAGKGGAPLVLGKDRGAIHFMIADCKKWDKPKLADIENRVYFPFIAQEIFRWQRELGFRLNQFAILVRDRHQSLRLIEYLERVGIASIGQRGVSLANSAARQALAELIRAILHPYDRSAAKAVLGGRLLGWSLEEVKEEGAVEFAVVFVKRLRLILFEKGFAACFRALLHAPCKRGGKSVLENLLLQEESLGFVRDLQQIADLIVDHQGADWHSPEGILPFLDHFDVWEENEDSRLKRFQDPIAEGVKILTLHFCKGLEFDVVFALGLINRSAGREDLIAVEEGERRLLSAPIEDSKELFDHFQESDAEKMRQLYVALTRAKTALYVPVALHFPSEGLKRGEAAPIELFLSRFSANPDCSYDELYQQIREGWDEKLFDFFKAGAGSGAITFSVHEGMEEVVCRGESLKELQKLPELIAPRRVSVKGEDVWVTSFSSIVHSSGGLGSFPLLPPSNFEAEEKTVHTLPANADTGIVLHSILEKIDFALFRFFKHSSEVIPLITPFLKGGKWEAWSAVIADMLFNCMHAQIGCGQGGFSLKEIESALIYREMPFAFSIDEEGAARFLSKASRGDKERFCKNGIVKGVIDGIAYHRGRYFLFDWKSHWLGSDLDAYGDFEIARAMEENGYFIQSELYIEALKRYLNVVEKRPFEDCFGGAYYLFLRGMEAGGKRSVFRSCSNSSADLNGP